MPQSPSILAPLGLPSPRWWRHPLIILAIFLAALTAYRTTLIGSGHFFWGDERTYLSAVELVDNLAAGDAQSALGKLFEGRGGVPPARPMFTLLSVLPVLAQRAAATMVGIDLGTLRSFDIPAFWNVLVSLGISWCVYLLARRWTTSAWYALLATVLFSLLASANVWIRHLVAYDEALLFMLLALLTAVGTSPHLTAPAHADRDDGAVRRGVLVGLLSALGYACYPGYYAFVLINVAVLLVAVRARVTALAAFGVSAAGVLGGFELLARAGGSSYLADLSNLSGTAHMGHFAEGYVFIWRYLLAAEGWIGIPLLLLFGIGVVLMLRRSFGIVERDTPSGAPLNVLRPRRLKPADSCEVGHAAAQPSQISACLPLSARVGILAAAGCYLLHATTGVLFHKMVFYGRVLTMYMPFLVIGAVLVLMHIRSRSMRRAMVGCVMLASLVSFAVFAYAYGRLCYPADLLAKTLAEQRHDLTPAPNALWVLTASRDTPSQATVDPNVACVSDLYPEGSEYYISVMSHAEAVALRPRFIGVNLKWIRYVPANRSRFPDPAGYALLTERLHPLGFPTTGFEGRKPWERRRARRRRCTMRIYQRSDSAEVIATASTRPPQDAPHR